MKTQKLRAQLEKEIKAQTFFTDYYERVLKCSAEQKLGLEPIYEKLIEQFN